MPYVEILGPRTASPARQAVVSEVTSGIVRGFGVTPSTVTIYFQTVEREDYAHEGALADKARPGRVFVKVHSFRRTADQRRAVAEAITPAISSYFDTAPDDVAVYFLDRDRDEVAHGGELASDH